MMQRLQRVGRRTAHPFLFEARVLIPALVIVLLSGCTTIRPATQAGSTSAVETFFVGEGRVQYFIKPLAFRAMTPDRSKRNQVMDDHKAPPLMPHPQWRRTRLTADVTIRSGGFGVLAEPAVLRFSIYEDVRDVGDAVSACPGGESDDSCSLVRTLSSGEQKVVFQIASPTGPVFDFIPETMFTEIRNGSLHGRFSAQIAMLNPHEFLSSPSWSFHIPSCAMEDTAVMFVPTSKAERSLRRLSQRRALYLSL